MRQTAAALALATAAALPAAASANDYQPIRDKDQFLEVIEGRELRLGLFGISLQVLPDGRIAGSAQGWDVTGRWDWRDGFFCREMDWGGTEIPYNCQLVEVRGDRQMRFTVDQGRGESAAFNLR